jgi:hypothetical protein
MLDLALRSLRMSQHGSLIKHQWPLRPAAVPAPVATRPGNWRHFAALVMLWTGALLAVALATTVLMTLWTLAELRARPAPGSSSGETAEAMLGGQLAWRAARHLGGETPPFLREMTTQLAAALAHSADQSRLQGALQCGPGAPPLLGSLAGGTWVRHVGIEFQLTPCAGSRDGVKVTLAPGGLMGLPPRVVDMALSTP